IRRAADVDVERAAALASDLVLDRVALVVGQRSPCSSLGRTNDALRRTLVHVEQVGRPARLLGTGRWSALLRRQRSRAEQQRAASRDRANEKLPSAHHGVAASSRFAGSSVATYPLGARRRSACGHITIRPPMAMMIPPIHTQITRGLKLMRSSAVSPRTPASTM